jgi:signal transduction histidine kinase
MLDSLLDHARADKLALVREKIDLNEVLADVLDSLRARLAEQEVEIVVPRPLPHVRADRVRVSSVLQNLISNAVKYNDSETKRVEIGYQDHPAEPLVLYVRDNGIGVEPRQYARIFELFRRLHGRESYGGGAGAGLTITRKLIERHGGRIWLESEPGRGSTFFFTLDAATSAPHAQTRSA